MVDRSFRLFLALASVLAVASVTPALAADGALPASPDCLPLKQMLAGLAAKYHEMPVSTGTLASGQGLVVLTASEGGETYTLLLIALPAKEGDDATACLIADGTGWATVRPATPQAARPAKPHIPRRLVKPVVPDESI